MSDTEKMRMAAAEAHATAIDGIRKSRDELLGSELSPRQQQLVLDLMNAAQDLNTAYWEQVNAPRALGSEALVDSLAAHQIMTGNRGMTTRCTCGWLGQVFGNDFRKDFITHQADMLTVPQRMPTP